MKNLLVTVLVGIIIILGIALVYQNIDTIRSTVEGLGNFSSAYSRTKHAQKADKAGKSVIKIGVVLSLADESDANTLNGIKTACNEINSKGGIFGRQIELLVKDNHGNVTGCKNATQEIIWDKDVVALIGGDYYSEFISMAPLCEFNGMLFMSPALTSGIVPYQADFKLVFTNYPNIRKILGTMYAFQAAFP